VLTEQKAQYRFKEAGLKITPQRMAVFRVLEGKTTHPTADDIYQEIKKIYPNTSMATVYNTLDSLVELGLVRELTIEPDRRHFDPDASPHHHVICVRCNRIDDIFEELPQMTRLPDSVSGKYSLLGYNVEFYGVCKGCQRK
jgi:Fur family peroxide stress response transcriptional regulator